MGEEVVVHGLQQVERHIKQVQQRIERNSSAATKAYAQEVQREVKARAPKRRGRAGRNQKRARLASHVKVYPVGSTAHKVKLTGHVWHLIVGDVREHEERAGSFRGNPSGKRALQLLDGYAARVIHPAHHGEPEFLRGAQVAAHIAAMSRARYVLRNG